jgi:FAD:protein FMN transferase
MCVMRPVARCPQQAVTDFEDASVSTPNGGLLHQPVSVIPPLLALTVFLLLSLVRAGAQETAVTTRRAIEFRGLTMGAAFSVKVVTGRDELETPGLSDVDRALRATLDRINRLMSTWDPDSELSRFNRSSSLEPFPVSLETFEVLRWSVELSALTGGALDVTVGPLVDAWGFGPEGPRNRLPSDEEIARLREATGAGRLELNPAALTVRKTRPDVRCDLSAVAPGYAADRLWAELADRGFTDFLVDVGGELRTRGRNDIGEPWEIAIERPQAQGHAVQRLVPISNLAIATSGDYRRYREVDGKRFAHILDPRTGRPLAHRLASVTVIDELAVRADGLATALMVLGSDEGMALAEKLGLAALFVERTNDGFSERATTRFEEITSKR